MVRRVFLSLLCTLALTLSLAPSRSGPAIAGGFHPVAQQSSQITLVRQVYDDLLHRFSEPLTPAQVLTDAWSGVRSLLRDSTPTLDALAGDQETVWSTFAQSYREAETAASDPTTLAYAAIGSMISARHNCHTVFLMPRQFQGFRQSLNGTASQIGLGVEWSRDPIPAAIWVYPESPAESAGVLPDDQVLAVDGLPFTGSSTAAQTALYHPSDGQTVRLTLQQPGGQPRAVSVHAGSLTQPDFQTRVLSNGVGLIRLRAFADDPAIGEHLAAALRQFETAGVQGWILDFRRNSGGSSATGTDILSKFLPEGTRTFGLVSSKGLQEWAVADGSESTVQRPLAVLIDHSSASMAEITAGALQHNGRAEVFGQTSLGCVNGGDIFQLSDGSGAFISTFRAQLGPDGFEPERVGIVPDQVTTAAIEPPSRDTSVLAASQYVLGTAQPKQPSSAQGRHIADIASLAARRLGNLDGPTGFKLDATDVHPNAELISDSDDPNLSTLLQQEGRVTGYDVDYVQTSGVGAVFSGPNLIAGYSLYADSSGARRAMDLYGELISSRYLDTAVTTTADVSLGDDAIEIHGAATRPDSGQFTFSILAWRHGCVLLYVMTQAPPGEEPATLLAPLAQALDTHYLGNPVPSSSVCAG